MTAEKVTVGDDIGLGENDREQRDKRASQGSVRMRRPKWPQEY